MRFKPKKIIIGMLLLHVVVFAVYLVTLQDIDDQRIAIDGVSPRNGGHYANVTSRSHIEAVIPRKHHAYEVKRNMTGFRLASTSCVAMTYPAYLSQEEGWYPADSVKSAYVFSAYHDEQNPGKLVIIGARSAKMATQLFCQIWLRSPDNDSVSMVEAEASANMLPEAHGRRYAAAEITCNFKPGDIPESVSIVTKKCSTPLNLLPVKRIKHVPYTRNFTVCLTPLNFRYAKAYELVEWIELNRILGAEFFTIYNFSSAPNIWQVLDYYKGQGLVEVVNWNLPMGVDTWPKNKLIPNEIHYFGQVAALAECWRRNQQQSEYLVFIDLDEFIVPRHNSSRTWRDIIRLYPSASAFLFQNVFFRKEWAARNLKFDGFETAKKYQLVTLLKNVRENKIFAHNQRSKYIIRSDSVKKLSIHSTAISKGTLKKVAAEYGLLHHYRNWQNFEEKKSNATDPTMIVKYKDDIIERVQNVWSELSNVEMEIPLT